MAIAPWNYGWALQQILANQSAMMHQLNQILTKETVIMSALTDLQASQAALSTAVTAAIADIQRLAAALAAATAGTADADVEAVVTQLNTLATNLQAAVNPPTP